MLTFSVHKLGSTALFRCAGRFVSGDMEALQDAIWNQWRAHAIVLDLAQIGSIDAAGLGMLLSLRLWAQKAGISFKLMNLTPRVEEMLELTNLRAAFEICSATEMLGLLYEAIEQARGSSPIMGITQPASDYEIDLSARRSGSQN